MSREHVYITAGWIIFAVLTGSLIYGADDVFAAAILAAAGWVGGLFTYALVVRSRKMRPRGIL